MVPSKLSLRTCISTWLGWCSTTSYLVEVFVLGKGRLFPRTGGGGTHRERGSKAGSHQQEPVPRGNPGILGRTRISACGWGSAGLKWGPGPWQGNGTPQERLAGISGMSVPAGLWEVAGCTYSKSKKALWSQSGSISTHMELRVFSTRYSKVCLILYGSLFFSPLKHSLSHVDNLCPSEFCLAFICLLMRIISMLNCLDLQSLSPTCLEFV